jgi:hypothetical protein
MQLNAFGYKGMDTVDSIQFMVQNILVSRWETYSNGFLKVYNIQFLSVPKPGIQSYHSNHHEDRRFKFKCCSTKNNAANSCYWTGYVNGWDGYMNYLVSYGYYLVGAYSIHDNKRE